MFTINDSSYPPASPAPTFADTPVGDTYRNEGNQYQRKISSSTAYDFAANTVVTPDPAEHCTPVSATLTITAP